MVKAPPAVFDLKIIIVGDGTVGKTTLLFTYIRKELDPTYTPTVMDNYQTTLQLGQQNRVNLDIWDTAGQEDFENIRQLSYPGADVFMTCYSTVSESSLENIQNTWLPEIRNYNKEAGFVLIGTKADLMPNFPNKAVPLAQAQALCKKLKGFSTLQCSAILPQHKARVSQAFHMAIRCGIKKNTSKKKSRCTLL